MTRFRTAISYLILGALVLAATGFMVWRSSPRSKIAAENDQLVVGEQVYAANCASCHGPKGEGHGDVPEAPALDASEHAWHHPDGQLQQLIRDGGQIMPAFAEELTNQEVSAVIRLFQTWWAPGQLQSQQSISEQFPLVD